MSKCIRILHIVGGMGAGGLETLIMNWYRSINRDKVQFDFLVHKKEKTFYEDEILSLGGRIYRYPIISLKDYFKYKSFLKKFFNEHAEYNIVHGHLGYLGNIYLKSAKKAGIKTRISHSHIASFSKNPKGLLKHFLYRRFGKYANYHFACSMAAGEYMYGKKANFVVINNGVDTSKFRFSAEDRVIYRNNFGFPKASRVYIHVGRFHDQKNHSFLIDVFQKIHLNDPQSILALIGVGPLQDRIKKKVSDFGLDDCVLFLGSRADVPQLLSMSDCFIFPSLYEGLPLTLIEAQCNGIPVLCSTSITEETRLIENSYFSLALNEDLNIWSNIASTIKVELSKRASAYLIVKDKGFDTLDVAKSIESFYLKCSSNKKEY